jgi:hypothetical protein
MYVSFCRLIPLSCCVDMRISIAVDQFFPIISLPHLTKLTISLSFPMWVRNRSSGINRTIEFMTKLVGDTSTTPLEEFTLHTVFPVLLVGGEKLDNMLAVKRDPFSGSGEFATFPQLKIFRFAVIGIAGSPLHELENKVAQLCPRLYSRGILKFESVPPEMPKVKTFRLSTLCRSKPAEQLKT